MSLNLRISDSDFSVFVMKFLWYNMHVRKLELFSISALVREKSRSIIRRPIGPTVLNSQPSLIPNTKPIFGLWTDVFSRGEIMVQIDFLNFLQQAPINIFGF